MPVREAKAANNFEYRNNDRIDAIMLEKFQRQTTLKRFRLLADRGFYMTPQEAIDNGWLDEIEG